MKIKIVNKSNNETPTYATIGSAGMDLRAYITEETSLKYQSDWFKNSLVGGIKISPMSRIMIPTGLYIQLPQGYEAQVRPRSGLAIKNGITVINTPGTIDEDYIGEICVLLVNLSNEPFTVLSGDRIAQMVINKYEKCDWELVEELAKTERGEGGFNSTGIK